MRTEFDIAADLDTPVSAWKKLAPFGPRFLLESVEGGERLGRYSFLGFGDGLEVTLQGGELRVGRETRAVPGDRRVLLDALRAALRAAPVLASPTDDATAASPAPPFPGGLVGFTGYDFVRRLELLPAPDRPRAPDPEIAWFAPRSVLAFDHLTRRAALLHDGSDAERRALRRDVVAALRGPLPAPARGGRVGHAAPSLERSDFLEGVRRARAHIEAGDVYQLVLSVRFAGESSLAPFEAYRALRLLNPSPYMYFLQLDGVAVAGSSPEALVRLQGRRAALRPIAGTRPRGSDPAGDRRLARELLADPKEAAEHVMLVDLARNDLGRVALPGSVTVEPYRAVERYSHVMHLVSGVEGVLAPGHDAFDLFGAAFPAGTVVGAPKIRAMQLLDELEPVDRGVYAGTVGYFGASGTMDQAIAIRTLTFREGEYAYQAGAGIVADSDPEREHAEVLAKGAALASALAAAEEGL